MLEEGEICGQICRPVLSFRVVRVSIRSRVFREEAASLLKRLVTVATGDPANLPNPIFLQVSLRCLKSEEEILDITLFLVSPGINNDL